MTDQKTKSDTALAGYVRTACLQAAQDAYETARFDGLCAEGAWECAVDAVRQLDLTVLVQEAQGKLQ